MEKNTTTLGSEPPVGGGDRQKRGPGWSHTNIMRESLHVLRVRGQKALALVGRSVHSELLSVCFIYDGTSSFCDGKYHVSYYQHRTQNQN